MVVGQTKGEESNKAGNGNMDNLPAPADSPDYIIEEMTISQKLLISVFSWAFLQEQRAYPLAGLKHMLLCLRLPTSDLRQLVGR